MKITENENSDCINKKAEGGCRLMADGKCFGVCAFFKTRAEQDADIKKVFWRLRTLPRELQLAIAEKYYAGKMVWRD